jgi:hypothetical protein
MMHGRDACHSVHPAAACDDFGPSHLLAYNIKRVIAILGVPTLIEAIRAFLSLLAPLLGRTGASAAVESSIWAK